ncbi:unnamed protein product [Fusarium graminearum]|nr:unnamed protein product [Fusarium graminearum]
MFFNCVPVLLNAIINSNSTNTNTNNDASEEGRPFRTCGLAEGVPGVKLDLVWPSTNFASDLKGHLRLEHQEGSSSSLKRAAPPTSDLKRAASPQTSRQLLKHQKGSSSNTKRAAPPASDLKGRLHLKHQEGSFSDLKRAALPQTLRQLLEHQEGNAASDLRPQGASSPRTPRR